MFDDETTNDTGWAGPTQQEWEATQAQLQQLGGVLDGAMDEQYRAEIEAELDAEIEGLDPFDDDFALNLLGVIEQREQAHAEALQEQLAPVHELTHLRDLDVALNGIEQQLGSPIDRATVTAIATEALRQVPPEQLASIDDGQIVGLLYEIASDLAAEQTYRGLRDEVEIVNAMLGLEAGAKPRTKTVPLASDDELGVAMRMLGAAR